MSDHEEAGLRELRSAPPRLARDVARAVREEALAAFDEAVARRRTGWLERLVVGWRRHGVPALLVAAGILYCATAAREVVRVFGRPAQAMSTTALARPARVVPPGRAEAPPVRPRAVHGPSALGKRTCRS